MMFPTPFFGRGPVYRGPVNYIAMPYLIDRVSSGVYTVSQDLRVSGDGLKFRKKAFSGDIVNYRQSNLNGAFSPSGGIKFGNLYFLYGAIWDDGSSSRCALFVSSDGAKTFNRLATAVDGEKVLNVVRRFSDAVVFGGSVVFLTSAGELAWTSNGVDVSTRANLGFTGSGDLANVLAAGTGFLIAAGANGQAFSVATPDGAATARNLQFGTSTIERLKAGNVLVAAGYGKISTCPLNNPAAWTARVDPVGSLFDALEYAGNQWFAAGFEAKWINSPDGSVWSTPANKPIVVGQRVRSTIAEAARLLVYLDGKISVSTDFSTWETRSNVGLEAIPYRVLKVA